MCRYTKFLAILAAIEMAACLADQQAAGKLHACTWLLHLWCCCSLLVALPLSWHTAINEKPWRTAYSLYVLQHALNCFASFSCSLLLHIACAALHPGMYSGVDLANKSLMQLLPCLYTCHSSQVASATQSLLIFAVQKNGGLSVFGALI